jgi:2-iminobutanoate/2-iminopropanoate deaminase
MLCMLLFSAVTESAGIPVGTELVAVGTPYSPGMLSGDTLYVTALQGTGATTHVLPDDFSQEARNCLENLGRVLNDAHMNYSDVVSVQIYLDDMSQFKEVNAIYGKYFESPPPARTTVQVAKLSLGAHIEISESPADEGDTELGGKCGKRSRVQSIAEREKLCQTCAVDDVDSHRPLGGANRGKQPDVVFRLI